MITAPLAAASDRKRGCSPRCPENYIRSKVTEIIRPQVQLACLLHDASEAYLADITRPVKEHLASYLELEARLQRRHL